MPHELARVLVILPFALLNAIVVFIAAAAVRNAARRLRDARTLAARRQHQHPKQKVIRDDPLAAFSDEELEALSISPSGSHVWGTKLFRRSTPDPWAQGFEPRDHHLATLATRLKDMVDAGTLVVDALLVVAGAITGVAATDVVAALSNGAGATDGPVYLFVASVVVLLGAGGFKVITISRWENAARRYRELTLQRRELTQRATARPRKGRSWKAVRPS